MTYFCIFYTQPPEQHDLEAMKHSMLDKDVLKARRSGLESADKLRNNAGPRDSSTKAVNVLQQNCKTAQEMKSYNDSANNAAMSCGKSSARNCGNSKLPGTSVKHMQQKSKSMSCDDDSSEKVVQPMIENRIQNEGCNELKRSASVAGTVNNGEDGGAGSQGSDKVVYVSWPHGADPGFPIIMIATCLSGYMSFSTYFLVLTFHAFCGACSLRVCPHLILIHKMVYMQAQKIYINVTFCPLKYVV